MTDQLVRKAKHLELFAEKNEEYVQKMAALKTEADLEKRQQLLDELDKFFNPLFVTHPDPGGKPLDLPNDLFLHQLDGHRQHGDA